MGAELNAVKKKMRGFSQEIGKAKNVMISAREILPRRAAVT